jgi:hypothetical protein
MEEQVSELSFLLDLLLNQKLSVQVKKLVAARLKSIEAQHKPVVRPTNVQIRSTSGNVGGELAPPVPNTVAAQQALVQRAELIAQAANGKQPMKNRQF